MGRQEIWTHSRLKMRMNCPWKEHIRYERELVPIRRKEALSIGEAVHKGIETWSLETALSCFDGIFPADQQEADELEVAKATVEGMLTGYFERYEPFEDHKPETEFKLPLVLKGGRKSRVHYIAGKIDDIVHTPQGDWLVEYKTASQLTGSYFERLYLDEQVSMYCYVLRRLGYNPVGVIYRVIRKPTIKVRKNESIRQYTDRLIEEYRARPDFYFLEQKLYRTQDDLDEFEIELRNKVQIFDRDKKSGLNFRNTSHCSDYGGCPYLPLCTRRSGAECLYEHRKPHEELNGGEITWD